MTEFPRTELAPGYSISRVINGCWQLTPDHGGGPGSRRQALAAFAERVEHGMTTFDCADIYAGTEALLGQFRRSLPDPDLIQVHTKLVPDKATLATLTDAQIDAVIDRSRQRLGTDRLDLVQFHWWDYAVPGLERLAERLLRAQSDGRIRLLGATNFDTVHVQSLRAAGVPLVALQAQYSLLDRRPERHMQHYAEHSGVQLLAYGALAGGFLSARYVGQPAPQAMNRSLQKYRLIIDEAGGWSRFQALLTVLDAIAARRATSVAAVAVHWVLRRAGVAGVIVGIGQTSRARQIAAFADLHLEASDYEEIDAQLATQPVPPGDMYDLEREVGGPHTKIIRTELQGAAGTP